jgi:signal transduction histidine kinase
VNTSAANGSGIGLACVKKLVDKMDGAISLESTPGEGTTFFLKFPLALP